MINRVINYLMIIFAFVFPISIAGVNILLGIMIFLWIIEGNFKEKFNKLLHCKFFWGILIIIFGLLFSVFISKSTINGYLISSGIKNEYDFIFRYIIFYSFLFVIFLTSVDNKFLKKILSAFILGMLFSEIISYLIYFKLIPIEKLKHMGLIYRNAYPWDPSPFMHHSFYSIFLSITILILIDNFLGLKNKILKFFMSIFIATATINLFINGGRIGQIAFVLGFLLYSFFKFHKKYFIFSILGILLVVFSAYKFSSIFHKRINFAINDLKLIKKSNYKTSLGQRIAMNKIVIEYLKLHPFGGRAGENKRNILDFAKSYDKNLFNTIKNYVHLHNQYFQYWIDGTIFTFLAYLFILFYLPFKTKDILVMAIFLIFALSSFSDVLMYRPKTFLLFLFLSSYFVKKFNIQ